MCIKSKPHKMGMQIPYHLDPQVPQEGVVWTTSAVPCRFSGIWRTAAKVRRYKGTCRRTMCTCSYQLPPKYSVAQVVGYIKGKSAIHIARNYMGQRSNFTGHQFWARGYFVSTVGRDEKTVREYIKTREKEDRRLDQLNLFK